MKKTSYILLLLSVFLLVLSTCRKKPELKVYTLELSQETVTVSPNSVTITTEYSYPGEVLSVKLLLSTFSDMSGSTEYETNVTNTTISVTLEDLNDNTTYYYRYRYANGIAWVDTDVKSFTTEGYTLPSVTTDEVSDITSNTAHCSGEATDAGNGNITAKGFCYGTNQNPTIYHNVINCGDSLGVFEAIIENLDINTTYYVRAFATNEKGTGYGEQKSFITLGQVPTVVTIPITSITASTAVSGGTITDNGGNEVTEKGVCWSTEHYPTTDGNHTSDGTGNGAFVSNLTDLLPNTQYYIRAYATNSQGTGYGNELTFTTAASLPVLTTKSVTDITENSAKSGGNITNNGGMDITARGICWSTEHDPTTNDSHTTDGEGIGEFDSDITDLSANVKYYVRAYATNDFGTAYGEEREFTTQMGLPTVSTKSVTAITGSSASCGGDVTNSGGGTITARGVCWSTAQNPTISDNHTTDGTGTGEFNSSLTGLNNNTTYYVRAYATNSNGTAYGEERSFTTQEGLAIVTTADVTNVTATTATSGGEVTDDGGFSITARGVCWSTSQNPTTSDAHTSDGTGTGSYTSSLSSLSYNTTYYVRAYATNSNGTSYGEEKTFTTSKLAPTVTTNEVTSITSNLAVCGGEVTDDGGASVTARGVCYSTSQNPTISGLHTSDGNGTGAFTSSLTGLEENTTYYVRAYATNSEGTSYGDQKTFTTSQNVVVPTLTTSEVTNVSTNSATCGGNVTSAGYGTVSARGVCWSTSQNPTVSNPHTTDGIGTGSFTSSITGLTENTTYYVRAYATNEAGTAYGEQKTFTTPHAATLPAVTTNNVTEITSSTAVSGGNVTSSGYGTVSARGVCYSTSQNPTITNAHTNDGTGEGSYTSNMSDLEDNTTYYVRAYATNEVGTAYGELKTFTTLNIASLPIVSTSQVTSITPSTATCGGNVTSDGNYTIIARGVCWSTSETPTIYNSHTIDGSGLGVFTSFLTDLDNNTTYYVRAYAMNEIGTSYGELISFTTDSYPAGAIHGIFTINENDDIVCFSQGNLQYQASTNTFRFAENQWDWVGGTAFTGIYGNVYYNEIKCDNALMSDTYDGWIDLYGWGTGNNPINVGPDYTFTNYSEWGNNAISNGGNISGMWFTLSASELQYIFYFRNTSSGKRYARAIVNGVNGIILLPDTWRDDIYSLNDTDTNNSFFTSNTINESDWMSTFEANGAIFMPVTGRRQDHALNGYMDTYCNYWTRTRDGTASSYLNIENNNMCVCCPYARNYGMAVRLVHKFNN